MAYKEKKEAIRYNNDFIKKAYDRINLTIPKGQKAVIQVAADAAGESVNAYIYAAVMQRMEREQGMSIPGDGFGLDTPSTEE